MQSTMTMLVAMVIIAISAPLGIASDDADQKGTIRVTGSGESQVAPDMAIITFAVLREADTARAALDANNQAMNGVIADMRDRDIESKDLQTSGFSISPRYHYPKRHANGEQPQPVIVGYRVSNQLTVIVRELGNVGQVLDAAVSLGVNSGGQIQFTTAEPESAISDARRAAMANAIAKAQTLTEAAGIELGRILEISETSNRPPPMPMAHARMEMSMAAADAVPVEAGQNSYRVTVNVAWQLEQ